MRKEVSIFFDDLETVMSKYTFRIFNMDETGITTVLEHVKDMWEGEEGW